MFTLPFVGGASINVGWATVRPGVDIAAVEAAYLEELERLATEPPTEDELERAKALTEADELGALSRVEERADRLSMYATLFDDPGLVNTLLPRYLSVTAEQIRDAAREVFRADNRVVLTYVPGAADDAATRGRGRRGGGMSGTSCRGATRPGPAARLRVPATVRATLANGLRVVVTPMPGRAADRRVAGHADRRGRRARRARRRHGPRGPALTEGTEVRDADRAHRGRRAARRLDPRRGRLGRDVRRARRPGEPPRRPRWSCSPRSSGGRRSRSARSTGCATSGSPTCCRRRPTRGAAPRRRSSPRSTRRRARTTGRRAAARTPSNG